MKLKWVHELSCRESTQEHGSKILAWNNAELRNIPRNKCGRRRCSPTRFGPNARGSSQAAFTTARLNCRIPFYSKTVARPDPHPEWWRCPNISRPGPGIERPERVARTLALWAPWRGCDNATRMACLPVITSWQQVYSGRLKDIFGPTWGPTTCRPVLFRGRPLPDLSLLLWRWTRCIWPAGCEYNGSQIFTFFLTLFHWKKGILIPVFMKILGRRRAFNFVVQELRLFRPLRARAGSGGAHLSGSRTWPRFGHSG